MKSQEDKMNITIDKMEYRKISYMSDYFMEREVNIAIEVDFSIGSVKGSISIPTEEVKTMDEEKVIKYIYNYLNSELERKFIDEI